MAPITGLAPALSPSSNLLTKLAMPFPITPPSSPPNTLGTTTLSNLRYTDSKPQSSDQIPSEAFKPSITVSPLTESKKHALLDSEERAPKKRGSIRCGDGKQTKSVRFDDVKNESRDTGAKEPRWFSDFPDFASSLNDAPEDVNTALQHLSASDIRDMVRLLPRRLAEFLKQRARELRYARSCEALLPTNDELKSLKKTFLHFLAFRVKNSILCHDCEAVHPAVNKNQSLPKCASSIYVGAHDDEDCTVGSAHEVSFSEAVSILVSYRLGNTSYGRKWDSSFCSSKIVAITENTLEFFLGEVYVSDDERLLTRHQHWMVVNGNSDHIKGTTGWKIIHPGVMCRHVLDTMEDDDIFDWENLITGLDSIYACDKCAMEFQVDVFQMSPTSTCLSIVVTAWRDLGRCKSAFDARWTSHFFEFDFLDNDSEEKRALKAEETDIYDEATGKILAHCRAISSTETAPGWREDDESAVSTSPPGTIRDMFENTTTESYTPLSRLDEEELFAFIRKKAYHTNRRVLTQPPPKVSDKSGMQQRVQDQRLAEMGRLEQWGGAYEVDSGVAMGIRGCLSKKERKIRKAMGKLTKRKVAEKQDMEKKQQDIEIIST